MNHYQILGLSTNATDQEIRKSFHKLLLKYHPDKTKDSQDHDHYLRIKEAYEILSNPDKRRDYDRTTTNGSSFAKSATSSSSLFYTRGSTYTFTTFSRTRYRDGPLASYPFGAYTDYHRRQDATFREAEEERRRAEERQRRKQERDQFEEDQKKAQEDKFRKEQEDKRRARENEERRKREEHMGDETQQDAFDEYWKHHGRHSLDPIVVEDDGEEVEDMEKPGRQEEKLEVGEGDEEDEEGDGEEEEEEHEDDDASVEKEAENSQSFSSPSSVEVVDIEESTPTPNPNQNQDFGTPISPDSDSSTPPDSTPMFRLRPRAKPVFMNRSRSPNKSPQRTPLRSELPVAPNTKRFKKDLFQYGSFAEPLSEAQNGENVNMDGIREEIDAVDDPQQQQQQQQQQRRRSSRAGRPTKKHRSEYTNGDAAETVYTPVNKSNIRAHSVEPGLTADILGAKELPGFIPPKVPEVSLSHFEFDDSKWQIYADQVQEYINQFMEYRELVVAHQVTRAQLDQKYRSDISSLVANFEAYQLALARDVALQRQLYDETANMKEALGTFRQNWAWYQFKRK